MKVKWKLSKKERKGMIISKENTNGFLEILDGRRIPFGWGASAIGRETETGELILQWEENQGINTACFFCITIAVDDREEKVVEIFLPSSNKTIGTFDIRYAYALQPFEISISQIDVGECLQGGVGLRLIKGSYPLWVFTSIPEDIKLESSYLLPHINTETKINKLESFRNRMNSLASVQPFGWIEGCVLEGLYEMKERMGDVSAAKAIASHLNLFGIQKGKLIYENPRSIPVDNKIYGIEATLPFAVIARMDHEAVAMRQAVDFWMGHKKVYGASFDGNMLSAEGSYTVAYPMAVYAMKTNNEELRKTAIMELLLRRDRLVVGDDLYLRSYNDNTKSFKNWARAYAWYMLGLIDTIRELGGHVELEAEFQRIATIALCCRNAEGLWPCFLKEPETNTETSGSAGIAAAFAKGYRFGILGEDFYTSAQEVYDILKNYLTSDGFLGGVSQMNRGGENLQRGGYRVISQMGMGLMAQLMANL